ncbi:MAG: ATP-binding cassette domain-containing protein [Pseudomonadota bacterium]
MPAVKATDLRFSYGARAVVDIENLTLDRGQSLAVIGPSGCGKTTFMHLLAGLLQPDAGRIDVLGSDITTLQGTTLDRFRGQSMGMVFQRLFLMPALSVRQNIALAQQLARKPADSARIDALLANLDITDLAEQKPRTLSQGQAQRVAIARALVHQPALVLADEPTSALDDDHAVQALALLRGAAQEVGAALVVVTHDQRVRGQLDREFEMAVLS